MKRLIKKVVLKYNLSVNRENKYKVFFCLIYNSLLKTKLNILKFLRGIKEPIIHYYCVSWNESKILPFVFQYYLPYVSKFYIYDNESDDGTRKIVDLHDNAILVSFCTNSKFNDEKHIELKNSIWKQSRGKADFVIVCDTDEFLYHRKLSKFFLASQKSKYTFFIPEGIDMYSENYPKFNENILITEQIKNGIVNEMFNKPIIFDPHKIVEINYLPGAHQAFPVGIVTKYSSKDLKLLHFKNLGIEHVLSRTHQYRNRLSDVNKEKGYGFEYEFEDNKIIENFNKGLSESYNVFDNNEK